MKVTVIKLCLLVLGIFLAGFGIVALVRGIWTYQEIGTLPLVEDPIVFTREFEPNSKISVHLKIKSKGFTGRSISSPFYPHKKLKTTPITGLGGCHYVYSKGEESLISREGRYINVDPFWKVFWVEIARCGEHTMFFGPYRQPDSI